tara:strand:- start:422 stop:1084 length:663 start_codon:yes stop_codon:yes gene_type:complete
MNKLLNKIKKYVLDPDEPINSFELGYQYELMGHKASAMGYYLKCAELTDDKSLAYECLLRKAICMSSLNNRNVHVRNTCLLAIALLPSRPEAYYLISLANERDGAWQESYAWAVAGQHASKLVDPSIVKSDRLITDVEYHGNFVLPFQEAVTLWWLGRFKDSIAKFKEVEQMDLTPDYVKHVKWNLENIDKSTVKEENVTNDKDIILERLYDKFNKEKKQ